MGNIRSRKKSRQRKTRLKNRTYAKFIPPQFSSDAIKVNWDPHKSAATNLSSMGLTLKSNIAVKDSTGKVVSDVYNRKIMTETPTPEHIKEKAKSPSDLFKTELVEKQTKGKFTLSTIEQRYIGKLMMKHALNYKRMFWDKKLNFMQHTETTLSKMGDTFLKLNDDNRVVPIPDNVL